MTNAAQSPRSAWRAAGPGLAAALLAALTAVPSAAQSAPPARYEPAPVSREQALAAALAWLPADVSTEGLDGRALFALVLSQGPFLSAEAGPFDLHVSSGAPPAVEPPTAERSSGRQARARTRTPAVKRDAEWLLEHAAEGLMPIGPLLEQRLQASAQRGETLVAGRRFPLVLASGAAAGSGVSDFDALVALLAECEERGFSGWAPQNEVWTLAQRSALLVHTWEVQLVNLAHPDAASLDDFLAHGLGYQSLAFLANRLLRQGSWGLVPPWLAQGLIDELDISAYGEAWVGGDWWTAQTPGWSREGWEGFVPQGQSPPAPITGPPADLATTVSRSGDSWQHRESSRTWHWEDLATDRKSAAPASFAFMAEHESFLPRDRALARLTLWLAQQAPVDGEPGLLARLDRPADTPAHGMPDSEPLPALLAVALGGVPEVARLEALSGRALVEELGQQAVARQLAELGADALLELSDHRVQSAWLYEQTEIPPKARGRIFTLILTLEYHQQMAQWKALGEALDRGVAAALETGSSPPKDARRREKAVAAFRAALAD